MTNRLTFDNIWLVDGYRRRSRRQNPKGQPCESFGTKGCQSRTETEEKEVNTRNRPLFSLELRAINVAQVRGHFFLLIDFGHRPDSRGDVALGAWFVQPVIDRDQFAVLP